jgi:endo-1,4-beta-D-glucanase Y
MGRRHLLASICLPLGLSLLACGSSGGGGGGSGGSGSGTGGTKGTGGSGATAASGLGTGKGYPFPQNKASGSCMLTTVASAATATQNAYDSWKSTYVTSSGAPSGALRVVDPQSLSCGGTNVANGTVSEGMGYGMLAAVYRGDRATFDGLFAYVNAHLDSKGLMNWCVNASGTTVGAYSATDADEDIIFALLMASDQWSGTDYLTPATKMITAMRNYSLFSDGTLQNGDNFNTANQLNIDYFSPAYYRVFTKATGDTFWGKYVVDANYKHLMAQMGTYGLVPNSSNLQDSTTCSTCSASYGYDACRMPWRIAMDWCFNAEPRAQAYLMAIGAFFDQQKVANIGDGYSLTGSKTSSNQNMAFIGPAGTAGMAGWPNLLNDAFNYGVSNPGNGNAAYFPQSLRVVTMLMMSGNLLDYSQM